MTPVDRRVGLVDRWFVGRGRDDVAAGQRSNSRQPVDAHAPTLPGNGWRACARRAAGRLWRGERHEYPRAGCCGGRDDAARQQVAQGLEAHHPLDGPLDPRGRGRPEQEHGRLGEGDGDRTDQGHGRARSVGREAGDQRADQAGCRSDEHVRAPCRDERERPARHQRHRGRIRQDGRRLVRRPEECRRAGRQVEGAPGGDLRPILDLSRRPFQAGRGGQVAGDVRGTPPGR